MPSRDEIVRSVGALRRLHSVRFDAAGKRVFFAARGFDPASERVGSRIGVTDWENGHWRWLTGDGEDDRLPEPSPDGRWLAFLRRESGGSSASLRLLPLDGGESRAVPLDRADPLALAWHPDSGRLAVVAARPATPAGPMRLSRGALVAGERPGCLLRVDVDGGAAPEVLLEEVRPLSSPAWIFDGSAVVVRRRAEGGREVPLFDLLGIDEHGDCRVLLSREPVGPPRPSPGGDRLALRIGAANEPSGRLLLLDPADGARRELLGELDRPLGAPAWFADGERLVVPLLDRGGWRLVAVDAAAGGSRPLPLPATSISSLVTDGGSRGAAVLADSGTPPEVWALDLGSGSRRPLTAIQPAPPGGSGWAAAEELEADRDEGEEIAGWIVEPPRRQGAVPLLLRVEDGPFAAAGPRFDPDVQALAAAGFAVLFGLPRGAGSCGEGWAAAAAPDPFGIPAGDLVALREEVLELFPGLRGDRLAAWGIGEGAGVVAALAARDGRQRALVLESGIFDPLTFALTSAAPWRIPGGASPLPTDRAPLLWAESPLRGAARIDAGVLLLHGGADAPRPASQSELLLGALADGKGELLLWPEAADLREPGHWTAERLSRILAFLEAALR